MLDTSLSLLDRLRRAPDPESWRRLVDLYSPLLHSWLLRGGVRTEDAEDLLQDVLSVVVRELPRFEHNRRTGAFRCWLRTIAAHRLRYFWKKRRGQPEQVGADDFLNQLEDSHSDLSRALDEEHDRYLVRRLLELMEPQFEALTLQAFRGLTIENRRAADVADSLGLTVNAVLLAKSRVLRRLREEARGFLD